MTNETKPLVAHTQNKENREKLQQYTQNYEKEIARQQFKIAELEAVAQHLQAELANQQGLKRQIKSVYRNLDNKIMRSIDQRGYTKTFKTLTRFPVISASVRGKEDLIKIARLYDADNYFHYYPGRESMRLRYRLTGKLYRTTRNVAEKSAKRSYQIVKRTKK